MTLVIVIAAISCLSLVILVLTKPYLEHKGRSISIYWLAPLAGALLLILTGSIGLPNVFEGLTGSGGMNPLKILSLFLSMTIMSIFLDNAGFFRRLACIVLKRAGVKQSRLFLYLYVTVAVLTVFTSNDIIVLTFTPFICYFAHNAGINPLPYLMCEFVAANTWSMALIIGNPTNIYLAANAGIGFASYISVMLLPTILAGAVTFGLLYLIFRKQLRVPVRKSESESIITDKPLVFIALACLALCIITLSISSYISIPMWLVSTGFMLILLVISTVYLAMRRKSMSIVTETLKRAPWDVVPFVLSMFVIVLALENCGMSTKFASLLSGGKCILRFGAASFFTANIINNIPMSVLFSSITASIAPAQQLPAVYASIIGSNLGAFLTPMGALAGIMWMGMLKNHGVRLGYSQFMKYGSLVSVPAMAVALLALAVVM